ncbi:hypothetical protein GmHk_13G037109 [Glycine max]|nr:hypothetical protein GmHk_13G037109 [Glycine max]
MTTPDIAQSSSLTSSANHHFYHATSKHGRVTIASFYMEGPALAWFQWMARSVNDYLFDFEALANRIVGLPTSFLLSCFISGLAPDICREVQVLQPLTLVQSAALARLQEEKLSDPCWVFRYRPHLPTFSGPLSIRPPNLAASTPLLTSPPKPASVPLKRLSP